MKKTLIVLLAALCLLAVSTALADPRLDCIAAVILYDGQETVLAGSAVQVDTGDGTHWLAPAALLLPDRYVVLMMDDGTMAFAAEATPLGDTGLAEIILAEPLAKAQAVPLSKVHGQDEDSLSFIGFDAEGTMLSSAATRLSVIDLQGQSGLSFTGRQEGMLPGAVISDEDAGVVGIMVSAWSEGRARYAALDAGAIRAALNLPGETPSAGDAEYQWVTGADVRVDGGYLVADLSGCGIPLDGSAWVMSWYVDSGNTFYTTRKIEKLADPTLYFPAVPGRSASLYIAWGTGAMPEEGKILESIGDSLPDMFYEFGEATAMDRYNYHQDCWLAATDGDAAAVGDTDLLPKAEISRSLLYDTSKTIWLQVSCSYEVEEDKQETLLVCLFDPDGQCLVSMASFLYGVDFMREDIWHADMTAAFRDLRELSGGALPGGTYTLAYYIGDSLAGSYSFELPSLTVDDDGSEL